MSRSVLIVSPKFFEYDSIINESFGEHCDKFKSIFYDESMFVHRYKLYVLPYIVSYVILMFFPNSSIVKHWMGLFNSKRKNYDPLNEMLAGKISLLHQGTYQELIVIKGAGFSSEIYEKLEQLSFLKKTLVLWDPIFRYPETNIKFFDKIFSTELPECHQFGWDYLGLFSSFSTNITKHAEQEIKKKYFVSFLGAFSILRMISLFTVNLRLKYRYPSIQNYFVLVNKIIPFELKLLGLIFTNNIVGLSERSRIIRDSQFVLSIEEPGQWGWTGRIADTICLGGRVITTSPYIMEWKDLPNFKELPIYSLSSDQKLNKNSNNRISLSHSDLFNISRWIQGILA